MPSPRDPDEVEQTLLPGASASDSPARPGAADTPSHPGAADVTLETSVPVSVPVVARPPVDADATLDSVARPAGVTVHEANGVPEVTILPGSISADASGAVGEATSIYRSDPDATMPIPVGRTVASGSSGPLGTDTTPDSVASGGRSGASPSATGTMVGRFALRGLHASGGLGEVFTARDTELNREVAVKRIKSNYADDPGSRRRFLNEAELTARLDHPGVVPVFGLVNDVRGRPCYAMRFIRGETFKDEIDRYHNQGVRGQGAEKTEQVEAKTAPVSETAPTPQRAGSPVPRSVAFRHLLQRFIATCQAIAYAHTKRIIHRDIKPANIMVGSFGETLVVDWGLAKSLDDGPDLDRVMKSATESGFRHDPEATDMPSHMTMAGTAVGTPAYMAPEQAAGEIEKVGPQADIYSLGATLFYVLTGKTPFSGKSTGDVLDRVRRGDYEPAIEVNPECPAPLDAICRKAMALRQEDRYATALELAADVERWLSDEPVSCYQDPFLARLARWARQHPARVATAVSLLLAGVLGTAVVAWAFHVGEQNTREEQKRTAAERDRVVEQEKKTAAALADVQRERDRVVEQEKKTEEQRSEAVAARNIARGRYEAAVAAYNVLVKDLDERLTRSAGMQDVRKRLLLNSTAGLKQLIAGGGAGSGSADRTLVAAYRQMGEVYQLVGDTATARTNYLKAVETASLVKATAAAPGVPVGDKRAADRDLGLSLERLADIHLQAGDSKAALEAIDAAIALFAALAEDKTDAQAQNDLAGAQALRGKIRMNRGETGRALEDINASLAARQKLSGAAPGDLTRKRDLAASLDALAGLQLITGRTGAAVTSAEESLKVRAEIASAHADQPDAQCDLAAAHARLGDVHLERARMADAARAYRAGLDVLKKLAAEDDKNATAKADLAMLYGRLGYVQIRTGDIAEAVENTKLGKSIATALQKEDPNSAKARRDLALARERHGDALLASGQIDEGTAEYSASEKLFGDLRDADKHSAQAKLDLARALERLGDGCMAKKDMAGAAVVYGESVKLREETAAKDAGSASVKRDLAVGLYKLAEAHCGAGQPGRAESIATRATDLFVALSEADPASAQAERDIALAYAKWGQVLSAGGHLTGALIVWQSSLERCEKLAKIDAKNVQAKEDEAAAWERLANFYTAIGNTDRARSAARTAVELWTAIGTGSDGKTKSSRRRLALAMLRYGDISTEMRQFDAARESYKKAAAEAGGAADPLLTPVAKQVANQLVYVDAVEAGLRSADAVLKFPEGVQIAALRTVATIEIRADRPTSAASAAAILAKIAKEPADLFAAAQTLAGCAAAPRGTEVAKNANAADAVTELRRAITAGFRDTDALATPEWDEVRKRTKDFAKVLADLEKLNEGK